MQQFSTPYILKPWLIIAIGLIVSTVSLASSGKELQVSELIRLNQLGFYPVEEKQAILACENKSFNINQALLRDVSTAALKAFYYQWSAMPLEERYAGLWNRPAGHPDVEYSYASNEVAINWQGVFTYFAAALDASVN